MKLFVFDVESVGLFGEGFWAAWCLANVETGLIEKEASYVCDPNNAKGTKADRKWVAENVPVPDEGYTLNDPFEVRTNLWYSWRDAYNDDAFMVADCLWPVEARFLDACVEDNPEERMWKGPYPFIDAASIFLAYGMDPTATYPRLDSELPEHNPISDCRQTARLVMQCLREHGVR